MISNKSIRNICTVLSVISLVGLLLLYFCPKFSLNRNPQDFLPNILFSIFGSTLVSGLTAYIYISSQIKETHISIALKLNQACYILDDPIDNHMLKDYPPEFLKATYEKIYNLINDTFLIMKEFELKNMSRLPMKTVYKGISTLSIINDICKANYILIELQKEMSLTNPDDNRISELWLKELPPLVHKSNDNLKIYLESIYGKKFVKIIDIKSINRLQSLNT